MTDATFLILGQQIELSPQLTAVIGGRGSGKSTLLEYIRYALGISALDVDGGKWDPTFDRRQALLKSTLSNATSKVEIELVQQGVLIQLVRNGAGSDRIYMQVAGRSRPLSLTEVRETFPVQAYSQGELSHLGDATADSRLFDLITTSHREKLNAVEDDIKKTAGELRKQLEQNVEYWRLEGELRKVDTQLATTMAGITNAKQGLGGLKQEAQAVINQHQEIATTGRWIEQLTSDYQTTYTSLVSAYDEHIRISERHLKAEDVPAGEAAQTLATALREHLDTVSESYLKVLTARQDFERQQTNAGQIWATHKASHNSAYEKVVEESSQYSSKLAQLNKLEEQQTIELRKQDGITRQMEPLQDALVNLRKTGALYISHQHELRRLSKLSADQLAGLTNNQARAELAESDDISKLAQGIKDLFVQSNVRETRQENLLSIITAQDTLGTWWKFLDEILAILRWKITGLYETDQRPQLPILDPTIEGGLQKFCEILTVNRVSQILTVVVRPKMQLLQKRGDYEIAFSQASQGEKATILLNVLMRQPGGPLLLDQPEEDLDNRIIGDIVKATQDAKNKKQLLFATHNANLVVNGDAELVVDLENGHVLQIGTIDLKVLRDSITETMEGGKEAFELRRHKYNF